MTDSISGSAWARIADNRVLADSRVVEHDVGCAHAVERR
jgi:hypothetical protein